MKLLVSQKNQLFKIIEEYPSLIIGKFSLSDPSTKDSIPVSITVEDTEFSFMIFEDNYYADTFNIQYIPGEHTFQQVKTVSKWDDIIILFRKWLANLKKELSEPNYWDMIKEVIPTISFRHCSDNSKFSKKEFEELRSRVKIISQQLESLSLINEQQTVIINQLERLTDLANDLGRLDWLNLLVGTIINIVLQLDITKEIADRLWNIICSALSMYFLT